MTEQELDEAYTEICHAMTALGEDRSELYLARLALLLMQALDEPDRIRYAIAQARITGETP